MDNRRGPSLGGTLAAVLAVLVTACAPPSAPETSAAAGPVVSTATTTKVEVLATTSSTAVAPASSTLTTTTTVPDLKEIYVAETIASLTLEEKVAQLLVVEFAGSDGRVALELLAEYPLGGFLLKSANGNIVSSSQVQGMTAHLQKASDVPLFIAIDQEGGRIDRIKFEDFQRFPAAQTFGEIGDDALTEQAAWATGVQLAGLGVNLDLAPVADVNVHGDDNAAIGDRAYGSDPAIVAAMVVAAVRGFERAGVAAAVKHFPGHGNTTVDSHLGLPIVETGPEVWAATDGVPFAASIRAGARMVMVAHIAFPALDPDGLPASLSRQITHGQLRQVLGFTGVIVTDDLAGMRAVAEWAPGERAVMALAAGSDLLLNPGEVGEAVSAIVSAVGLGRLSERTVDASLERLLSLKFDLGLLGSDWPRPIDAPTRAAVVAVGRAVADACVAVGFDC